jgi:hypothetical protein
MSVPIEPWKRADNFSTSRHQELVDGINLGYPASGAGEVDMLRVPGGVAISVFKDGRIRTLVRVRIDSAGADGGCYNAFLLRPPDKIKKSGSGDLSQADLMSALPSATDAYVLNAHEETKSTHDLTNGAPLVRTFLGELIGVNGDGKYVVVINGLDIKDCTTTPGGDFAPAEDPSVYHGTAASSAVSVIASR